MKLPRFYPILDTDTVLRQGLDPVQVAREILDAGAEILQFRHKGFLSREAFSWLEQIAKLAGPRLVVNDRADLAVMFDAALHVGQDDLRPHDARRVIGSRMLGYSTHNEAQLRAAADEPADYLALGPLFGTASKENPDTTVGLAEFARLRPLTARPLVAIGGITLENARAAIEAGADSLAVIGGLFTSHGSPRKNAAKWVRFLT